jgi:hypothetical protein
MVQVRIVEASISYSPCVYGYFKPKAKSKTWMVFLGRFGRV